MRITGTLTTIGDITTVTNFSEDIYPENYEVETTSGIFIAANIETLRAASNLLCCTVDIYPHPVNELIAGECTPENYAHAMARLAHAEAATSMADHLAREVRSSQALIDNLATLEAQHAALLAKQAEQERLLSIYRTKYHEAANDAAAMAAEREKHPPGIDEAHALIDKLQAEIREYEADDAEVYEHAMDNLTPGEITAVNLNKSEGSLVRVLKAKIAALEAETRAVKDDDASAGD